MKTMNTIDRNETRTARETIINTFKATRENGPQETVKALVAALGYDRAVVAVAELVNGVGDWDARVETSRRTWAAGIENAASREELAAAYIYTPGEIHPAHIDQIAAYMMRYEPETATEEPAEEETEEETEPAEEAIPDALQVGDVVEISGAYFKNDNGLYFVTNSNRTGWRNLSLQKIGKTGKVCKHGSNAWPLRSYCSDRLKSAAADAHNAEHAKLTRATVADLSGVAEWFRAELSRYEDMTAGEERRGWTVSDAERARLEELRQACARFASVSAPEKKEPEKGIRFYWNGIKVDGGELIKCGYSAQNDGSVTIYAHNYGSQLPREYFKVRNDTDIYTDYFDKDGATVDASHPLYKYVRYAAAAAEKHDLQHYIKYTRARIEKQPGAKSFYAAEIEKREKRLAELQQIQDPGQPTPEDLEAVEAMNTAAETARIEAEKAAQQAEREKMLNIRAEGRRYIESVQAAHPVQDGAPVVEIPFSEYPAFYSWMEARDRVKVTITTDGHGRTVDRKEEIIEAHPRLILSVAAADDILRHFDGVVGTEAGYYKTDFVITWTDENGEPNTYTGRYDIGDGDGGIVEHVRALGRWDLEHAQTDEARERAQARIDTAEMLARYLPGGEIVKVELAPWVLAALDARRKKDEEARERFNDTLSAVEMLTDEQLIQAVNLAPYADPEKRDVGRFFLQQLAKRDEKKALDVFRRWIRGEEAPLE